MKHEIFSEADLAKFVKERAWKLPDSYIGPTYEGYIYVLGMYRDAEIMTQSNFHVAHKMLQEIHAKQENQQAYDEDDLTIAAASHWAVGWVETILVRATNIELVREAAQICKAIEDYPVLDDEDFSEREWEERGETISLYTGQWMTEIGHELDPDLDQNDYTQEQLDDLETLCVFLYEEDCSYRGQEDAWARTEHVSIHELEYQFKDRWGYFSTLLRNRLNQQKRA